MPELPEVETTVRGLKKHVEGQKITEVIFYRPNLRYPLENTWIDAIKGQTVQHITRRAKSIAMQLDTGFLSWHLGMTGSMRISKNDEIIRRHDHIECYLSDNRILRFHDPRRFGYLKYFSTADSFENSMAHYGPEPLSDDFDAEYLWQRSRTKKQSVKNFIMNQAVVVGVGNIYACESLFLSGIAPQKPCGKISRASYKTLVKNIQAVLLKSIEQGGTTLKDFENAEAKPGYFQQSLFVYGRAGLPCAVCESEIKNITLGGRSSFYCPHCQR